VYYLESSIDFLVPNKAGLPMKKLKKLQLWRRAQNKPLDLAEINALVASKSLRVISITENDNHWYYWLRGNLFISNLAHFFVVVAQAADGTRREIHVAFDPLAESKGLQVLLERAAA